MDMKYTVQHSGKYVCHVSLYTVDGKTYESTETVDVQKGDVIEALISRIPDKEKDTSSDTRCVNRFKVHTRCSWCQFWHL